MASLLFTPVILPTNVAFLFFYSGVGLFCFLSRKSFAILTENKWAFECTWSPLAINQAKRPPQHFMRKLYLYSIKRLQNHLSFKSDDLLSCVEDQMVFCISITQYFFPSQCHLTHARGHKILFSSFYFLSALCIYHLARAMSSVQ